MYAWYETAVFRIISDPDQPSGRQDIETVRAVLASDLLMGLPQAREKWEAIYGVTPAFLGGREGLGPAEYAAAYAATNPGPGYLSLLSARGMADLKAGLADAAEESAGLCMEQMPPGGIQKCLSEPVGMRMFQERAEPISGLFLALTGQGHAGTGTPLTASEGPEGLERGLFRGLDVMAALGSARAYDILESDGDAAYDGYEVQLGRLRGELASADAWLAGQGSYWKMIMAAQKLLEESPPGHPAFMRTEAWEGRDLRAALAFKSELKSSLNTYPTLCQAIPIRQCKDESWAAPRSAWGAGYAEPATGVYLELADLMAESRDKLDEFGVLNEYGVGAELQVGNYLERLAEISSKVAENAPLGREDYEFMSRFDAMMAGIGHNADVDVRLAAGTSEDPWSGQVPERTGYLDILVVAYDAPGGGVRVAAGPIFSYYEFRHAEGGLTDEEWREALGADSPPRPKWVQTGMK